MRGRVLKVVFLVVVLAVFVGSTVSYCSSPPVRLGGEAVGLTVGGADGVRSR